MNTAGVNGALCCKIVPPLVLISGKSLRLDAPGTEPVTFEFFSTMSIKWFEISPNVNSSNCEFKGLIDKFSGAGRIGKGNFTTTNPFLASTYASASDKGSVIPVYIMAEKVIDAKKTGVDGVMAFDKAADRLGKNEVIVGNFGFDANAVGKDNLFKTLGKENYIKQMQEAGQKYTDTQYAFTGDTQVFSAISGEKLSKYNKGGIAKQMSNLGV